MRVYDKNEREIYLSVYGKYRDDIQAQEAYYVDTGAEVPEDVVEYLMEAYAPEIDQEWIENKMSEAEAACEGDR